MEDAHIARPGVSSADGGDPISLFGVFDGHGGTCVYFEALTMTFCHPIRVLHLQAKKYRLS